MTIKVLNSDSLGSKALETKLYNGFMLVSVDSAYYSKRNIKQYCQWTLENFPQFLLFIVDKPQMYNYWALKGLTLEDARKSAEKVGSERENAYKKIVRDLRTNRIKVSRYRDIESKETYRRILQMLSDKFNDDKTFRLDIISEMEKFRWISQKLHDNTDISIKLARFLVDEVSAYLYLSEFGGYPVEVSSEGPFEMVKKVYEQYGDFPRRLGLSGNVGFIQARI